MDMPPRQHLEMQQALFKQFAEIIDFTLKFDDLKVTNSRGLFTVAVYQKYLERDLEKEIQIVQLWHDGSFGTTADS